MSCFLCVNAFASSLPILSTRELVYTRNKLIFSKYSKHKDHTIFLFFIRVIEDGQFVNHAVCHFEFCLKTSLCL